MHQVGIRVAQAVGLLYDNMYHSKDTLASHVDYAKSTNHYLLRGLHSSQSSLRCPHLYLAATTASTGPSFASSRRRYDLLQNKTAQTELGSIFQRVCGPEFTAREAIKASMEAERLLAAFNPALQNFEDDG
jgi:hypothetical protein